MLFPKVEPTQKFYHRVSEIHELYVEEVGNPRGQPVIFLHGGPGAGISPMHRQIFDPKHFRIILFDQRGAGLSRPHAELRENTTWDLVEDIETLRKHFGITKWMVFGGSWGSTLALAYAEKYPAAVSHLVIRGIFLCRESEIEWFYQQGAHQIFPDFWKRYIAPIPPDERHDFVTAFYKRLTSDDAAVRLSAAKAWSGWEGATIHLIPDESSYRKFTGDEMAVAVARIESHYFINKCWWRTDNQLIEDVDRIRHIPTVIVHGRYDVVCPVKNAFDLHDAFPEAELRIIPDAGHGFDEPGILKALMAAVEKFKI